MCSYVVFSKCVIYVTYVSRERFMLPLGKLCHNVLRFLVHLYLWTVINFCTIFIVNFTGPRLYNQRIQILNVLCYTGDFYVE